MKIKDWLAFITLGLNWGSSFLWIKIAVSEVSPIMLVAIRLLFGILGSAVVVLIAKPAFPKEIKLWLILTLIGFTNNALPYVLISWGEQYIDFGGSRHLKQHNAALYDDHRPFLPA